MTDKGNPKRCAAQWSQAMRCEKEDGHSGDHRGYNEQIDEPMFWSSNADKLREQIGRVKMALLREDSQRAETLFRAASGLCIAASAILGSNAHGIGPDTDGGPSPHYRDVCENCGLAVCECRTGNEGEL